MSERIGTVQGTRGVFNQLQFLLLFQKTISRVLLSQNKISINFKAQRLYRFGEGRIEISVICKFSCALEIKVLVLVVQDGAW